ncbi:uncharacterized protein EDB93DRAFT_1336610 [Suillus bovinus]|uniref:uncharacterized protein n=1 Tax=Suillus bovinus TaxID=48563 RepID=UPI001B85E63A|nr:uncharacterized protein EDB93DRAFT_1336610 [Suillus bovinus]KAG2151596.1 hypothetical protein EDB93DRAFT_1336610 [Suillus bovinus]
MSVVPFWMSTTVWLGSTITNLPVIRAHFSLRHVDYQRYGFHQQHCVSSRYKTFLQYSFAANENRYKVNAIELSGTSRPQAQTPPVATFAGVWIPHMVNIVG